MRPYDPLAHYAAMSERSDVDPRLYERLPVTDGRSPEAMSLFAAAIEAARGGSLIAMCRCAQFYRSGWGVDQNLPECVEWSRRAAATGYGPGNFELGRCYEEGSCIKSMQAAIEQYEAAAEAGYGHAALHLSLIYAVGPESVPRDVDRAVQLASLASALGDPIAPYELGMWFESGEGVQPDEFIARSWYSIAASRGNNFACLRLSLAYQKSDLGLPHDLRRADQFRALSEAADVP